MSAEQPATRAGRAKLVELEGFLTAEDIIAIEAEARADALDVEVLAEAIKRFNANPLTAYLVDITYQKHARAIAAEYRADYAIAHGKPIDYLEPALGDQVARSTTHCGVCDIGTLDYPLHVSLPFHQRKVAALDAEREDGS